VKLLISYQHGMFHIQTPEFEARSLTLDGALADARKKAGIPEFEVSSNFEMSEVLSTLVRGAE
jgi:hypothetical protein